MHTQTLRETPAYPLSTLLSDVGGSLGLYIGIPILGLVEAFHFAVLLFYSTGAKTKSIVMK